MEPETTQPTDKHDDWSVTDTWHEPELLEPTPTNKISAVCAMGAIFFAIVALLLIMAGITVYADEPTLWQVWECPAQDTQCLISNGISEFEANLIANPPIEDEGPELIYLDNEPGDWYIVCYDAKDIFTQQYCKYVEVEQMMIDKYGLPIDEEGWDVIHTLVEEYIYPLDTTLNG